MLNVYPKDFTLYKIGIFHADSGMIESVQPAIITTAEAVKAKNGNSEAN